MPLLDCGLAPAPSAAAPAPAEPAKHEALDDARADKMTEKQTMLEAHEACVEADGANAAKFKDVIDFLKQDLHLVR